MGKGTANYINTLYLNIKENIKLKNVEQIQSNLSKIDKIEDLFLQSYTKRKKEGGYYTTDKITNLIVSEVLISLINKLNLFKVKTFNDLETLTPEHRHALISLIIALTVCDPSCGSGAFLITYGKKIVDLLTQLGEKIDKIIFKILENTFGFDINENAIKLCRLKLFKWFFELNFNHIELISVFRLIETNIQVRDSITQPIYHKFSIIIGNPPYGNILSENQKITLEQQGIFHKDIYCAFILKALEWSKGIIGFLIPKSFLIRQSYIDFRALLLERANLIRIYDIGPNIFKKATNEVQIVIYEKENIKNKNLEVYNPSGMKILTYLNQKFDTLKFCKNPQCPLHDKSKKIYVYSFNARCPYCGFKNRPINRIRIKVNDFMLSILDKIEKTGNLNYLNVHDFPKLIRGEEDSGLAAVKDILEDNILRSCIFLNAKNDLMRYRYQKSKSFDIEKINPKKLKGENYEYYQNPKLLIKHNNTFPVAVYTEEDVCFTSSIYSLLHTNKIELKYLCALLNSSLIKFYCIYGINNQMDTTINLNQYMIRHLPIPVIDNEIKNDLALKVDSLITLYDHPEQNEQYIGEILEEIDKIIFQIYLIAKDEILLILKSISG
ncbi:MAG: Eco57I restriction-modification methylase domain-containing protein [Candidatus Thorarchaeota archaeon]